MGYGDWIIGGRTPSNIESVERNPAEAGGNDDSTITFHCVASYQLTGQDPRVEVEAFNNMSCQIINNDRLLNGGSKLQVQGGDVITVTEHTPAGDVDYTAALEPVRVVEDDMADQAIWYDLVVHYELTGRTTSSVYIPPYTAYSNIDYSCYVYEDETPEPIPPAELVTPGLGGYGSEIGRMVIAEPRPVRYVQVKGSACWMPGNWIKVNNGEKQYWHYSHEHVYLMLDGQYHGQNNPQGHEVLGFDLSNNPTETVTLVTSPHWQDFSKYHILSSVAPANWGCWLEWVRVIYL